MSDDSSKQRRKVQEIYSGDSDYYITSTPHAKSSSLTRAAEILRPEGGIHLDVATGAGHTAFQMAPKCDWVIASDLTQGMLESTRKNGAQKGVENYRLLRTDSENIALKDGAVDSVSVRIAPHLGDLKWVEGTFPTPMGVIKVRHEKKLLGGVRSTIEAPKGVEIVR